MSTTGACGTDGCNHPYTVGVVSTPYGCESKEMNIRSDWVFLSMRVRGWGGGVEQNDLQDTDMIAVTCDEGT